MIGPESHWERVGREAWQEPDITWCERCGDVSVESEDEYPLCHSCFVELWEEDQCREED